MEFREFVSDLTLSAGDATQTQTWIHGEVLKRSPYLESANFVAIHPADLERLFHLYDKMFFHGQVRHQLASRPLKFAISRRMTSSAGKTTHYHPCRPYGGRVLERFEIGVSATLLFQNFQAPGQALVVSGLPCHDRLEALQRVFEHELVHLIEMLIWIKSSCSAERFQGIARRVFRHTEHKHRLTTPRDRVFQRIGLRTGDRVCFRIDGRERIGVINRITKRATVLVEDSCGTPYSDGKRYAKFYVPVSLLKRP